MSRAEFSPREPVSGGQIPKVEQVAYLNEATKSAKAVDDAGVFNVFEQIKAAPTKPQTKHTFASADIFTDEMKEKLADVAKTAFKYLSSVPPAA